MLQFHVIIHARPPQVSAGAAQEIRGVLVQPLVIDMRAASRAWQITFDEALEAFQNVAGVFTEPDGSFFRVSPLGEPRWQVEGNLYDQGDRLAHLELKGSCPEERLDEILRCLGWPHVSLVFQLVREGVSVDEADFRKVASRAH